MSATERCDQIMLLIDQTLAGYEQQRTGDVPVLRHRPLLLPAGLRQDYAEATRLAPKNT